MKKKTGVFPGSFDPMTVGHIDVIKRAARIFDELYVAVSNNTDKKYLFDLGTRCELARGSLADIENVSVISTDLMTAELAAALGADALVKGVRSAADFENERAQSDINFALGGIETVLLVSKPELSFVSSSFVRELIKYGKPADKFVSPFIADEIIRLTKK